MSTERVEVEVVVCDRYADRYSQGQGCDDCGRDAEDHETPAVSKRVVAPGTRTEALLRLAEAAVAVADAEAKVLNEWSHDEAEALTVARRIYRQALAAVRVFDQEVG